MPDHAERAREIVASLWKWHSDTGRDELVANIAAALAAVERDTAAAKDAEIEAERARHAAWAEEVRVGVEHLKTELTTARAEVAEARAAAAREIKDRIDLRMNNHLVEMKPDYDDSITGFNEAWDIVREAFADILPLPGDSTP